MARQRIAGLTASALATLTIGIAPVLAHHSFSMFDQASPLTITGVVSGVEWTNPHVYIELDLTEPVKGAKHWSIELGSPSILQRGGWKFNTVKRGDKVTRRRQPAEEWRAGQPAHADHVARWPRARKWRAGRCRAWHDRAAFAGAGRHPRRLRRARAVKPCRLGRIAIVFGLLVVVAVLDARAVERRAQHQRRVGADGWGPRRRSESRSAAGHADRLEADVCRRPGGAPGGGRGENAPGRATAVTRRAVLCPTACRG